MTSSSSGERSRLQLPSARSLRLPVVTTVSTPSGNGLWNAAASAQGAHPDVHLISLGQDDGHRLRMNRAHHVVRLRGQEATEIGVHLALLHFPHRCPVAPLVPEPRRHLLAVGGVGFREADQRDQAAVFRPKPAAPVRRLHVPDVRRAAVDLLALQPKAGDGMPQRAIVSSRSPSTVLTMGAIVSGNTPGNGGRLPVWACMDRVKWRMADWPWVIEQRLQMGAIPSFTKTQPLTAGRKQSRAVRDSLHADGWIASEGVKRQGNRIWKFL